MPNRCRPRPAIAGGARALALAALLLLGLGRGAAAQAAGEAEGRSTAEGVFTEAQAERGEILVRDTCGACHQPEYFQGTFLDAWEGAFVSTLYDLIRTSMPEDNPASLRRSEYADVLAYIFLLNGLPAGDEELGSRKSELDGIVIERRP